MSLLPVRGSIFDDLCIIILYEIPTIYVTLFSEKFHMSCESWANLSLWACGYLWYDYQLKFIECILWANHCAWFLICIISKSCNYPIKKTPLLSLRMKNWNFLKFTQDMVATEFWSRYVSFYHWWKSDRMRVELILIGSSSKDYVPLNK